MNCVGLVSSNLGRCLACRRFPKIVHTRKVIGVAKKTIEKAKC